MGMLTFVASACADTLLFFAPVPGTKMPVATRQQSGAEATTSTSQPTPTPQQLRQQAYQQRQAARKHANYQQARAARQAAEQQVQHGPYTGLPASRRVHGHSFNIVPVRAEWKGLEPNAQLLPSLSNIDRGNVRLWDNSQPMPVKGKQLLNLLASVCDIEPEANMQPRSIFNRLWQEHELDDGVEQPLSNDPMDSECIFWSPSKVKKHPGCFLFSDKQGYLTVCLGKGKAVPKTQPAAQQHHNTRSAAAAATAAQ